MIEYIILAISIMAFLLLITLAWGISTYNFFQNRKEAIKDMWSNIITEYQRRYDLFMNLGRTVKSYKEHEKQIMIEITKARAGLQSQNTAKVQTSLKKMDNIFAGMKLTFEAYPDLKANKTHEKLMEEVRITEDRINIARTSVNDIIQEYNTATKVFPSSIIANMYGFTVDKYYEGDMKRATNNAPEVEI